MKYALASLFFMCTTPLAAQEWAMRQGDVLLTQSALRERLAGQTITFYDNGRSAFGPNGGYSYTYDMGGSAYGIYDIRDDSTICIEFQNGASRCDLYVMNGERLLVITEAGGRFPVRPQ